MNGYTYGDNNPIMNIDPDGHLAWFVPIAIHGARIAAPHVGRYVVKMAGKKLAKRYVKQPLKYKGNIGKPRINVTYNKPSIKDGPKNGITYYFKNKKLEQKRYYDAKGRSWKDIDYSNHGNPKAHPVVPHKHYWKWKNDKPKRSTWYSLRKKW